MNLTTLLFWTLASHTQQKKWKSSLIKTKRSFSSGSSATAQSDHTETHSRDMLPAGCRWALSWYTGIPPVCFDRDFSVFGDIFLFHFTQFHFVFWTHVNVWSMQYPWPHNTAPFVLNLTYISFDCCLWHLGRHKQPEPFPFVLIRATAQSSLSKDSKSSFI